MIVTCVPTEQTLSMTVLNCICVRDIISGHSNPLSHVPTEQTLSTPVLNCICVRDIIRRLSNPQSLVLIE